MKIIHTADLHLDSKMETLPAEKSKIRREEVVHTFERLADYATKNGVSAVIICGDMFDTSRVSIKTKGRVLQAVRSNSAVDFLYLSGNHDDFNFIESEDDLPKNLKVFGDEWTKFSYGDVVISGVKLMGINTKTAFDTLSLNNNDINIVALHGQVAGYKSDKQAELISLPALKGKHIDYLALGHVHMRAEGVLDNRAKFAYCGCLEGRGFDETGDKGFILLDIADGKVNSEFIKFSSRNLYEYSFDVSGKTDWYATRQEIIERLTSTFDSSSLVKLVLTGDKNADFEIDKDNLALRLNETFFFAKVYDNTKIKVEIETYALDKTVRGEFVREVFGSDLDEEKKSKIITCGLNALKGDK